MKNIFKFSLPFFFLLFSFFVTRAQVGGTSVFTLLNQSPSARVTAMGGNFISVLDGDASLAYQNPALLNPAMSNQLSLNYTDYLAGIKGGYAGYAHTVKKIGTTFNGGIQFLNYGDFVATDELGNTSGTFNGSEYVLTLGAGREYSERFYYGLNATFLTSRLGEYTAAGAAVSLAGAYNDSAHGFTATVQIKNVGTQFKSYTSSNNEPLPFDLQAGISKRVEHTPFLFSLVLHDLYRWDIRYSDPNEVITTSILLDSTQQVKNKDYTADKIFLHTIIGTEIYFGKNFHISIAYNHQRRAELAFENRKGLSGFSFGAGIKINRFSFDYGRAVYNLADGVNHLSLGVNLDQLFGKRM
ncbi:MAG: type IX secretion system protein PorQ [Chitinophagales bacterium]